jgi:F-type H+-transporting ATPase subunit b
MLEINPVTLFSQALAFIILIFVIGKFGLKPLQTMIETRQHDIQQTLTQIAEDRKAMEQTRADYEQRLTEFEAEARERITEYMKTAQTEAAGLVEKARSEAAETRERALADIDQERKKAISQIRSEMADLAVNAAGKILEREINPATHRELIGDFINRVGGSSTPV